MGFSREEEKAQKREIAKEKAALFEGESIQPIGRIPKGAEVSLTLNPNDQVLNIHCDRIDITLPYDRIVGFEIESEASEAPETAGKVLSSGLLGRGLIGAAGAVAGKLMPRKVLIKTVGTLSYSDKSGETKELCFARQKEFEHSAFGSVEKKDDVAVNFMSVVNTIASRRAEDIKEL